MNILALPTALAFTMNLTLCLVALSSKPRDIGHRLFACFVLSFAAWNLGKLIMISSINPIRAIFKPIKMEEVELVVQRALLQADLLDENGKLKEEIKSLYGIDSIVSKHEKMIEIMGIVRQVAESKAIRQGV